MIIAIDGPSSAGKGTLGKAIAQKYHLGYLDTGLLYRVLGFKVQRAGVDVTDRLKVIAIADTLTEKDLIIPNLRNEKIAKIASCLSAYPDVRKRMLTWIQAWVTSICKKMKGAVVDGRDIGTVVFPQADVKLYVTAGVDVRAKRRFMEISERGEHVTYDAILQDVHARDERDITRADSPLIPASDAIILDTTAMTREEVFTYASGIIDTLAR